MEASGVSSKRPACDNCKDRKRVLISPRYDEAIESVDRSLKEVSQAVQQLLEINKLKSNSSPLVSPTSFIGNHSPNIPDLSEGYRGESSFKAHVHRVTDALKDAAADLESTLGDDSALSATVQRINQATGSEESSPAHISNSPLTAQAQHPELEGRSLPSTERVLKLVRLCQTEKQRFFIDVPVIDEQEFGLKRHHYPLIDINESDIEAYSQLLKANLEAAIQSLRLCSDPSTQACQALAVLSIGHNPPDDDLYKALAVLLDFMMYGLVTIAYRVIPCDEASDSPLKCSNECTEAARSALRTIVRAFESWGHLRITGWTMLLNMMFSLVPFASFVVLAGHTVATASEEDLTLLCSAVSAIEPTSISSPSAKKLYDVCKTFYELASFAAKRRSLISKRPPHTEQVYGQRELGDIPSLPEVNFAVPPYDHIMAPQDWDAVMNEFDLGTGASAMASFVEPYIPFDGRLP
ncbi:uncharacterized protein CCOS01_04847 [Colletotrichum costaricense]|uniref:Fungal specific transcription factor n=1 Tax=Colletotrichum costaricense TaxID=1209916 RepID=A0AAJ0E326_9PEZI|nr:uncharacterized protein CCOS01_04847 [Colletotrichum costaricense]KAK1532864.1 hypothetical protein CCOS01_04847 [Colletotrichum costaricense]